MEDLARLPAPCLLCGANRGVRTATDWECAVCGWRIGDVPDPDLPRPRVEVVYYLRLDARVKIGTTGNPRQRFAAIGHEELLAFERGGRSLERERHARFADDRLGTSEWFRLSPAIVAHLASITAGAGPWDHYARWVSDAFRGHG